MMEVNVVSPVNLDDVIPVPMTYREFAHIMGALRFLVEVLPETDPEVVYLKKVIHRFTVSEDPTLQ